ncbi:aminoacyl-tRNA hydrolase [Candidatus Parcubacteria bacterium]|jgi:ribosome-associated protein|nr:aminoacyl-tRNA hydrolase [Candidatus Parcubacteria bacterium]MBT3948994.1 aminoacyl-tRNA hydrolase [Candidatus Parcubacteria bacterium]
MSSTNKKQIPESEIKITFARSSGAGGQNVNKTSTKAILHWNVGASSIFSDSEKERIRTKLKNKLNDQDEIVVMAEEERSQLQNRTQAISRLQSLVSEALIIPKRRKPTKPTYSSKLKRLETKKQRSKLKASRRSVEE